MPKVDLPISLILLHKSQGILGAQGHFWWLGKRTRRTAREEKHGGKAKLKREGQMEGEIKMEAEGVGR